MKNSEALKVRQSERGGLSVTDQKEVYDLYR